MDLGAEGLGVVLRNGWKGKGESQEEGAHGGLMVRRCMVAVRGYVMGDVIVGRLDTGAAKFTANVAAVKALVDEVMHGEARIKLGGGGEGGGGAAWEGKADGERADWVVAG